MTTIIREFFAQMISFIVVIWAFCLGGRMVIKNCCESGNCSLSQEKIEFIATSQSHESTKSEKVTGIKIKIFGKKDCPICKKAIENVNQYLTRFKNKPELNYYDLDTLDGLTAAAIYTAFDVPTIIIENNGQEIKRWKNIPQEEELNNVCCGLY